jgi:uroporphyrinogen III methyltransferase / synthase
VFGRGGEEAEALRAAGISFEVVPGVTAGVAGPAYAGIPVTHRDLASAVAFVTGHEDPEKGETALDWDALAAFPGTLVLYMGVRRLEEIAQRLVAAGRSPDEPAAVIERGTLPDQRTVEATLGTLAERVRDAEVRPPAVTVVGAVAALRERLAWREDRPLQGLTVAVTRARAQAGELTDRLRGLGANVVEAPVIRIVPRAGDVPDLAAFDLLCLTSPNGVDLLWERLSAAGRDSRALAGLTIAAIGPGTARALRRRGIEPDVLPERSVAESLVEALADLPVRRALVARASEARDVLPEALRDRGVEVEVLALYDTVAEPLADEALAAVGDADYVTFTSSSTVRFLLEAAGGDATLLDGARVVSIGPVTSDSLRERGIDPHVQATQHDVDGLVEALVADADSTRTA